ncbi:MAG: YggT family protein [Deltaproteobacteria bacterium]|jgi:YggT family protein
MFIETVAGNIVLAVATVINIALRIYLWIIIIRVIVSWIIYFNPYGSFAKFLSPYNPNPLVQFLYRTTEPVLWRIRRLLPFHNIGIDFSPLIVLLIIYLLQIIVVRSLLQLAFRLG